MSRVQHAAMLVQVQSLSAFPCYWLIVFKILSPSLPWTANWLNGHFQPVSRASNRLDFFYASILRSDDPKPFSPDAWISRHAML